MELVTNGWSNEIIISVFIGLCPTQNHKASVIPYLRILPHELFISSQLTC